MYQQRHQGVYWSQPGDRSFLCSLRIMATVTTLEFVTFVLKFPVRNTILTAKSVSSIAALKRAAHLGDGWMHASGGKDDLLPLTAKVKQLRERACLTDRPFSIYVISMDAYIPGRFF